MYYVLQGIVKMFHLDIPLNLPSSSSNLGILNDDLNATRRFFFPIRNHQGCPGEVWSSKGCSNCRPHDIVFKRSPTCCSKLPDAAFWEEEPGSRGFFHRFCFRGHSSSFGASPNLFLSQLPILKPPRVYALCLVAGVVEVTFECLEHSQVGILRFGKDSEMFL